MLAFQVFQILKLSDLEYKLIWMGEMFKEIKDVITKYEQVTKDCQKQPVKSENDQKEFLEIKNIIAEINF